MYELPETGGCLTVDLSALTGNWQTIASHVHPAACAAVVKANAYGTGLEPAATALWEAGARHFFVAHLGEALRVRRTLPFDATIYALNGLPPQTARTFIDHAIYPVLGSLEEIADWHYAGGKDAHCALHVDTGMNRLGVSPAEALELASQGFKPAVVMSHLACADEPDHPQNQQQLDLFTKIRQAFPDAQASLANSAASLGDKAYHFDLCRPGIALYGGIPNNRTAALEPVVKLQARVVHIRTADAGARIGYGAAHTLDRPTTLAILSMGYADGIFRTLGASSEKHGGYACYQGIRCPIIGRISMDLIAVDVTGFPDVQRGDWMTLIGDGISVDDVAAWAGTISYEILTSLSHRAQRVYKKDL